MQILCVGWAVCRGFGRLGLGFIGPWGLGLVCACRIYHWLGGALGSLNPPRSSSHLQLGAPFGGNMWPLVIFSVDSLQDAVVF